MDLNSTTKNDVRDLKSLFGDLLPQRFLTYRLLNFLVDSGVISLLERTHEFTHESAKDILRHEFGFDTSDQTRSRMTQTIIDFLYECELIKKKGAFYSWNKVDYSAFDLSQDELGKADTFFSGQVSFFDECINYAGEFLSGSPSLFRFDEKSLHIWELFLGNAEFETARILLMKLLSSKKGDRCNLLNLCPGIGFDISVIQHLMPDVEVTAIDFTDVFRNRALQRVQNPETIRWIDSSLWNGFGYELPFSNQTFDLVFFSCADPYIPQDSRDFVYRDIFRTIKSGGSLGILTKSYPDPEENSVKDRWIRRGVLCHDFAESVCEGWYGFSMPDDSVRLFNEIGFDVSSVLLNASLWRLDKQ